MNKNEQAAYNYLLGQGYGETDINFNSRRSFDFLCSDGKRYEAKTLHGRRFLLTERQQASFTEDIIIIVVKDGKVILESPLGEIKIDMKTYRPCNPVIRISDETAERILDIFRNNLSVKFGDKDKIVEDFSWDTKMSVILDMLDVCVKNLLLRRT